MPEESTDHDLVELTRRANEAANRSDFDALMRFFAPDAVLDLSHRELPSFEGAAAIRNFFEDWYEAYEEFAIEQEEVLDLGNGIVFAVVHQNARPAGSAGHVQQREGWVLVFVENLTVRMTTYGDVDEARAAAEQLAESTAEAMSLENVRTVERVYERVTASLEMPAELFDSDYVLDATQVAPDFGVVRGREAAQETLRGYWSMFDDYHVEMREVIHADETHVVNVAVDRARMKDSDAEVTNRYFHVWTFAASRVVRLSIHSDRSLALAAAGLPG
jgi:ketosteroid isomerase-like protein